MNYDHKPSLRAVVGMKGTGKTTLLLNLLSTSPHRWKFVYDPELEVARKLHWQAASSVEGLCLLFDQNRPVVYYPWKMFDDPEAGLDFFCEFVLQQSRRKNGPKLLNIDEIQECTKAQGKLPKGVKAVMNIGRREEIDLLIGAQAANDLNGRVRRQVTEIYVFKQSDLDFAAFKALKAIGIDPEAVKALPHPKMGAVGYIYRDFLGFKTQTIIKRIGQC